MENTEKSIIKRCCLIITYAIFLFAVIMNLGSVHSGITWIFSTLSPLWIGLLIALIINVPLRGYEKLLIRWASSWNANVRMGIAIVLALFTTVLVVYLSISYVVPQLITAVTGAITLVTENADDITSYAEKLGLNPTIIENYIQQAMAWMNENIGRLTNFAFNTVVSLVSSLTNVILSLIFAIYLLVAKKQINRQIKRLLTALFPQKYAYYIARMGGMFINSFGTFFSRQCLDSLILGVILLIGMLIFQIPYALSIACLTAVLALIPYIGAYCAFFIGGLMLLLVDPTKALIFVIWFLSAQQIEGNFIYPHVVGSSVGLPPYLTLASVLIGGAFFGVIGIVLIIPIVSVAYELLAEWVNMKNAKKLSESPDSP